MRKSIVVISAYRRFVEVKTAEGKLVVFVVPLRIEQSAEIKGDGAPAPVFDGLVRFDGIKLVARIKDHAHFLSHKGGAAVEIIHLDRARSGKGKRKRTSCGYRRSVPCAAGGKRRKLYGASSLKIGKNGFDFGSAVGADKCCNGGRFIVGDRRGFCDVLAVMILQKPVDRSEKLCVVDDVGRVADLGNSAVLDPKSRENGVAARRVAFTCGIGVLSVAPAFKGISRLCGRLGKRNAVGRGNAYGAHNVSVAHKACRINASVVFIRAEEELRIFFEGVGG